MRCLNRITLTPRSHTYCMRDDGHPGPCSIHADHLENNRFDISLLQKDTTCKTGKTSPSQS